MNIIYLNILFKFLLHLLLLLTKLTHILTLYLVNLPRGTRHGNDKFILLLKKINK